MTPDPRNFPPDQGPGDVDMVIATQIQNPFPNKNIQIISSKDEFGELNGKVLWPGEKIEVNLFVPAGYREYIKPTSFKGAHCRSRHDGCGL